MALPACFHLLLASMGIAHTWLTRYTHTCPHTLMQTHTYTTIFKTNSFFFSKESCWYYSIHTLGKTLMSLPPQHPAEYFPVLYQLPSKEGVSHSIFVSCNQRALCLQQELLLSSFGGQPRGIAIAHIVLRSPWLATLREVSPAWHGDFC